MNDNLMTADRLARTEKEIEIYRTQLKKIRETLSELCELRDSLKLEINKDNLESMEWLIKNPHEVGVSEALRKKFEELYGGDYQGIVSFGTGYHTDKDDKPLQKAFEFNLTVYDDKRREELQKLYYANICHFIDNYLQYLQPVEEIDSVSGDCEIKVVPFMFKTSDSHLDFMGYEPLKEEWYWYTVRYGRATTERKFRSFPKAFDKMIELVNQKSRSD